MPLIKTFGAVAAAMLLVAVPNAHAQHRSGGHSRGGGGGGGRASTMHVATPRSFSGPRSFGAPRSFAAPRIGPRTYGTYGSSARVVSISPRSYSYGASRVYVAQHRGGAVVGHAVPRVGPRFIAGARYGYPGRYGYPVRFYRPYYAFRPRLSLGFGLWVGFPIAYPYYYGYYDPFYAYGYPYPAYGYPYPYAPYGTVYPGSYPAYPPAASYPAPAYPESGYPQSEYPQTAYPQTAYPPASGSTSIQPGSTGGRGSRHMGQSDGPSGSGISPVSSKPCRA